MSQIIFRVFSFVIAFSCVSLMYSQSPKIELVIEDPISDNNRIIQDGEPVDAYDVSKDIEKVFNQANGALVFLFFCPESSKYTLDDYKNKLIELKNSVILNGGTGKVYAYLIFYRASTTNSKKAARFTFKTTVKEDVDNQRCYVLNANVDKMNRLCGKYSRQFKSTLLTEGLFSLELEDNDKCFKEVPDRIAAYARAVRELVDPDFSQEERNQMFKSDLERLNKQLRNVTIKLDSLERVTPTDISKSRSSIFSELEADQFLNRDNFLSGLRFDLSLFNYEFAGKPNATEGISAHVSKNTGLGYGFRVGQRVMEGFWLDCGLSATTQTLIVATDSAFVVTSATDPLGTSYTQNRYFKEAKEKITIRRNTIPLTCSYRILKRYAKRIELEAFGGLGITFVSSVSSQFTEGTVDTRASYDGFGTEIANVPVLGLADGLEVSNDIRFHQVKRTYCGSAGIRARFLLIDGTSLLGSVGYVRSGVFSVSNADIGQYSALNNMEFLRQNPFNISLGFSHCFKYEKK